MYQIQAGARPQDDVITDEIFITRAALGPGVVRDRAGHGSDGNGIGTGLDTTQLNATLRCQGNYSTGVVEGVVGHADVAARGLR